jgi:hypothetical protein
LGSAITQLASGATGLTPVLLTANGATLPAGLNFTQTGTLFEATSNAIAANAAPKTRTAGPLETPVTGLANDLARPIPMHNTSDPDFVLTTTLQLCNSSSNVVQTGNLRMDFGFEMK